LTLWTKWGNNFVYLQEQREVESGERKWGQVQLERTGRECDFS